MRGTAWQITRVGVFLLFAVVLAALGPTDAALAGQAASLTTNEHKPDPKEHRDGEKLRERLPSPATHRRDQMRHEHDRNLGASRWTAADFEILLRSAACPGIGTDAHHVHGRLRHSPAMLQVMRH
ncbi:hypothetical protein E1202_29330 [Saccharopolyspora karakumensis]|uniref:Uncharacterized protein n=1 Tax=Saccharopolyspora karakumensis TaxID=2530386 RepID=A0A4R5B4X5_9PSEU|nr:hypothetical protein [Saccharopolyspora karakumensis]TDD81288.1 hypothetical protein E1202_29330 [Saccharopolyspora karakumensis]